MPIVHLYLRNENIYMQSTAVIFFSIILFIRLKMLKTTHHNNYTGFFFNSPILLYFFLSRHRCCALNVFAFDDRIASFILHYFFFSSISICSLRCSVCTHSQYALINSQRGKWNWNNGILKSDTLLPFHLTIYTVHEYLHATLHTVTERERRGGGRYTLLLIICSAQHFSYDITFRQYVSTYLWTHVQSYCEVCISKLELVHYEYVCM